jgi:TrmH family RNA methyltransferase
VITSPHNEKLKLVRRLRERRVREREGLFVAEGEDLVDAAEAAGARPVALLRAGEDIEADLLAGVSSLGSGTRVLGIYRQQWANPAAPASGASPRITGRPSGSLAEEAAGSYSLAVYLHGVGDPGNVGAVVRSAHALSDGPVVLGPGCADPYSPKAVRASMGSIFARPPARAELGALVGTKLALDPRAERTLVEAELEPPVVILAGAEREGLPGEVLAGADLRARIPVRPGGPDSLNVAMAVTVALYEVGRRMAGHA